MTSTPQTTQQQIDDHQSAAIAEPRSVGEAVDEIISGVSFLRKAAPIVASMILGAGLAGGGAYGAKDKIVEMLGGTPGDSAENHGPPSPTGSQMRDALKPIQASVDRMHDKLDRQSNRVNDLYDRIEDNELRASKDRKRHIDQHDEMLDTLERHSKKLSRIARRSDVDAP